MALTKAKKNDKVKALATELESSTSAIIGSFKGLTAGKDFELRKVIRSAGGHYHVVKNKLAARSAKGTKVEAALQGLKGVSSVAYTSGDPVALAKALSEWVKENAEFTFKLGIIDGKLIQPAEIEQLAKLPGKQELFGKLLFLINSPAQRLVTVLNATGRNVAVVINQGAQQGKFGTPAPAAKAETPAAEATPVTEVAPAAEGSPVAEVAAAHVEESAAGEQPSGAAEPENSTASQAGEAANTEPAEG